MTPVEFLQIFYADISRIYQRNGSACRNPVPVLNQEIPMSASHIQNVHPFRQRQLIKGPLKPFFILRLPDLFADFVQ